MLGNETSFLEEITMEMWTEGVSPVKEIHIATTIMCLAGFLQVRFFVEVMSTFTYINTNSIPIQILMFIDFV